MTAAGLSAFRFAVEVAPADAWSVASPTWRDVSDDVVASAGIECSRGRQSAVGQAQPGSMTVTLENHAEPVSAKPAGRWTPGTAASTTYLGTEWKLRRPVRLRVQYAGTWYALWRGHTTDLEPRYESGVPRVAMTAADILARLDRFDLRSAIMAEVLADSPVAYWPLDDAVGSTVATDRTGVIGRPSLTVAQVGTGGTLDFGAATMTDPDASTAAAFTPVDASNGKYLVPAGGVWPTGTAKTYECFFRTGTDTRTVLSIEDDYGNQVWVTVRSGGTCRVEWNQVTAPGGSAQSSSSAVVTDSVWHHVAYVETTSGSDVTGVLYVDGVDVGTDLTFTYTGWDSTPKSIAVGASMNVSTTTNGSAGAAFDGAVAQVAVHASALSVARIAARYAAKAGNTGDLTSARFLRIPTWTGLAAALFDAATGASLMSAQPVKGRPAGDVAREIATAEQGVYAADTTGRAVLYPRSVRFAATTAALTLDARSDILADSFTMPVTDEGLVNDVTATRAPGGAKSRAVNATSVTDYGTTTDDVTLYVSTDGQAVDIAQWTANTRGTPTPKPPTVRLSMATLHRNGKATAALGLDVGSLVTLTYLPGDSTATTASLFVEGIRDEVGADDWIRTLSLSWVTPWRAWILEDATLGVLDTTTVLGF